MAETQVSDQLWQEFHTVVNMPSVELRDWLRAQDSGEQTEVLPEQAGSDIGRQVLHILGKRRADLTASDIHTMQQVVDRIRSERGEDLEPTAGEDAWRHRLMGIGHDPLRPPNR